MRSINVHAHGDRGRSDAVGRTAARTPPKPTDELPLQPPSPYKSKPPRKCDGQRTSVTAAFMRKRRTMLALADLSAVAAPPHHSECAAAAAEVNPVLPMRALGIASAKSCDAARGSAVDEPALGHFFYEKRLRCCASAEENMRNHILACEEVVFTNLVIEALQARAELIAGDEAAEIVIKASRERAEARRAMMMQIEEEVASRLQNQRIEEFLAREFEALLPRHAAGRERILREEAKELLELFLWQKEHRPLGAGRLINGPEEDYRLRSITRSTSVEKGPGGTSALAKRSHRASPVRSSRLYLAKLLQKRTSTPFSSSGISPLAITASAAAPATALDGTLPARDEAVFAEEGRARLQAEKHQFQAEARELWQRKSLEGAAAEAREYVLAEEAMCWMQITRLEVDGMYEALEATRERKKREAIESEAASQREKQRNAVKERLLLLRGLPAPQADDGGSGDAGVQRRALEKGAEESDQPPTGQAAAPESGMVKEPRRRSSASTVPDGSSPRSGALQEEASTSVEANAAADDELAHLRLITVEITDPDACKQLTALTKGACNEEANRSE
ncbi:hypothetical protein LSCM1_01823 [Leishmania martiniquensis]|uniref:Uncharacterized protein n=1 Tax=Leishmania martiniquensis TaxID=1580590 RepID=A0A836GBY9_9TRYP|nr:hypothetical protein LSCM1_01823 [Leishmania martiniquensis]